MPTAPELAPGRHLALVGATASGKSALAMALARRAGDVELVSVDSMQVYRGMDVGTAKPSSAERAAVPHHLLDLLGAGEECSVSWFRQQADRALAGIESRGHHAVLVGGTGLYHRVVVDRLTIPGRYPVALAQAEAEPDTAVLHAWLARLDPLGASRIGPANRRRVVRALEVTLGSGRPFSSFGGGMEHYPPTPFTLVGVAVPRDVLDARIVARLHEHLEAGLVDEVRSLLAAPGGLSRTARQALGYREVLSHLEAGVPLPEAVEAAERGLVRFARRQDRWFRRDPRIHWVNGDQALEAQVDAVRAVWPSAPAPLRPR